jgi:hypothetical protein
VTFTFFFEILTFLNLTEIKKSQNLDNIIRDTKNHFSHLHGSMNFVATLMERDCVTMAYNSRKRKVCVHAVLNMGSVLVNGNSIWNVYVKWVPPSESLFEHCGSFECRRSLSLDGFRELVKEQLINFSPIVNSLAPVSFIISHMNHQDILDSLNALHYQLSDQKHCGASGALMGSGSVGSKAQSPLIQSDGATTSPAKNLSAESTPVKDPSAVGPLDETIECGQSTLVATSPIALNATHSEGLLGGTARVSRLGQGAILLPPLPVLPPFVWSGTQRVSPMPQAFNQWAVPAQWNFPYTFNPWTAAPIASNYRQMFNPHWFQSINPFDPIRASASPVANPPPFSPCFKRQARARKGSAIGDVPREPEDGVPAESQVKRKRRRNNVVFQFFDEERVSVQGPAHLPHVDAGQAAEALQQSHSAACDDNDTFEWWPSSVTVDSSLTL